MLETKIIQSGEQRLVEVVPVPTRGAESNWDQEKTMASFFVQDLHTQSAGADRPVLVAEFTQRRGPGFQHFHSHFIHHGPGVVEQFRQTSGVQ